MNNNGYGMDKEEKRIQELEKNHKKNKQFYVA
jgi:hypothetical protein